MKKNIWLLISLIAVIFVSGAATGFFTGRLTAPKRSRRHRKFSRSKEKMKAMFQQRICKRFKLTDEQKKSAQIIIDTWLEEMGKLRQLHAPQYLAVFNNFYAKIAPMLNDEQKKELDKWRKKFTKNGGGNASK
ncbi:MAG: hypothetical protein KAS17_07045 [Victivallaceae bacterium]|nr:hypothetical protein [Victivallaceae bacterium]